MTTFAPTPDRASVSAIARRTALAGLMSAVAACGGGGGDDASGTAAPAPAPAPAPTVSVTLVLEAPAAQWPGTVWLRTGTGATTRAAMTRQDVQCSPVGPGTKTCTFRNIPRGQTVSLVASDQLAEVGFGSTPYNARDADPRGIRSQFLDFVGPCATPERGVCVFTASADQTITVRNTALKLTRLKFIGNVNWRVSISALPTLNIANELHTDVQSVVVSPESPSVAECITDPVAAVNCFSIISSSNSIITFEALPPRGPAPLGSSGPLQFVAFDNACNSNTSCTVTSEVDENITMKWEYYKCSTQAINPRWNLGPTVNGLPGEVCPLTRP